MAVVEPALSLRLRCDLAACASARQALEQLLQPRELSARAGFALDLVLEELLMNQILHAHPGAVDAPWLELQAWTRGEALWLRFIDDGIAFDPLSRPAPAAPASLDEARPGGLGLQLLRRYARSLDYERQAGHNRLTVELSLS